MTFDEIFDNHLTAYRWLMFGCCNDALIVCLICFGTDIGKRRCGCDGTMTQLEAVDHLVAEMEILAK